jgi:hypothetical protein
MRCYRLGPSWSDACSLMPAWGLWAYLILIGCAADRQTVTYDALARRIKRGGPNLLAKPLALITRWCQHHSLPALASLVVEQATRLPAPGFAANGKEFAENGQLILDRSSSLS